MKVESNFIFLKMNSKVQLVYLKLLISELIDKLLNHNDPNEYLIYYLCFLFIIFEIKLVQL